MRWLTQALGIGPLLASTLVLGACDTHFIQALEESPPTDATDAGDGGQRADPCATLSADQCAGDVQDGCSVQPNPIGCVSSDPTCPQGGVCAGERRFVQRSGGALLLQGAPFGFIGAVSWQVAWNDRCYVGNYSSQEDALGPIFDQLAAMRVSVLRIWAFQSYAGTSGMDYSHFDRLVARARWAGIRLLFVLENIGPSCSTGDSNGPNKDDTWFSTGYKSPYGTYALSYRDYVKGVVTHFSDEPTILGWELMQEAGTDTFSALDGWVGDMTQLVASLDTKHLISVGLNNGTSTATSTDGSPSNYQKLQARDAIDLIDVHDFSSGTQAFPDSLAKCQATASALGKVIFAGATAVNLDVVTTLNAALQARATTMESKILAAKAHDFRGFLVYDYVPNWNNTAGFDFDSRAADPLAGPTGILNKYALTF